MNTIDLQIDEYLEQQESGETMEEQFALKETNEEIRKCEAIISKLMDVRKQYEEYSNVMRLIDSERHLKLFREIEKIDDKIFSFIDKKNNLKSVNDK